MLWLVTQLHPTLCNPMDCSPLGSSVHGDSPGKNTGVGCHALLQGIFPTQGLNPGLPHYRQIFLPSEPPGKPKNTGVGTLSLLQGIFLIQESCIAGGYLPTELQGKPIFTYNWSHMKIRFTALELDETKCQ